MKTNMLTRNGAALAILALLAAAPAMGQSTAGSAVGGWLYGADGEIVGSVRSLSEDGLTALVQYGTIQTPGNKLVTIPAEDIRVVDGRATLRSMTADAVHSRPAHD